MACHLFDRFPGNWTVGAMCGNRPGVSFWRTAIAQYTSGRFRTSYGKDSYGIELVYYRFGNGEEPTSQST